MGVFDIYFVYIKYKKANSWTVEGQTFFWQLIKVKHGLLKDKLDFESHECHEN